MYEEDKKTILIVDDEQSIIDILVYNLKKEGYDTIEATDRIISSRDSIREKAKLNIIRHNAS